MSLSVLRALLQVGVHRRDTRVRGSRRFRFRFGLELLEDRITPTTVTGLSPAFGPAAGSTLVTITGTGFTGVTAVNFGTTSATNETVLNATTISAESPPGTGVVDVTVTASGVTSPTTPADEFTYAPTVTGLSPSTGPAVGGTLVTIIGTGFTGATAVHFGTSPATNVTVVNSVAVTAMSPAGSSVVNVTVTTPAGTSAVSASDQFTYPAAPSVSSVTPNTGPAIGGTSVTIAGTGFTGATAVDFGTNAATNVTVVNDSTVTAISPAGAGVVDVTVVAPGGTSPITPLDQFTYGPLVTSVSPRSGLLTGGTVVTISGASLDNATAVDFGTTAVTSFISDSANQIVLVSPAALAAGAVDVTVTTPLGTSATSSDDLFFYTSSAVAAPTVSGISPTAGPPTGGTLVTIIGTGYDPTLPTAVDFGTTAATNVTVVSATTITADSPAGTGTVDVTVITLGGTSPTSAADLFSYAPTVTGVSPTSGTSAGGTQVTITGTNLGGVTAVFFGTTPATTLLSDTPTQIIVDSPASTIFGPVDVTVTTAGGTSATSSADLFTFSATGAAVPRVFNVSPPIGSPAGGTFVTITGTGFDPGNPATVFFGQTPATNVTVESATTIIAQSPPGSGAVTVTVVTYGGPSFSTPTPRDIFAYVVDGPQVTSVERYGYHNQPTYVVIGFNDSLGPSPARDASNYQIVAPNGHRIKVRSAVYNTATHAVTLLLSQRLNLPKSYRLTVNGTAPSGLTNSSGLLLDGAANGQPGSNYVTLITKSNLAGPDSQRPVEAVSKARARHLGVRLKSSFHKHSK